VKKHTLVIILFSFLSLAFIQACSDEPEMLLDEETYGNVLVELTIVNQLDEAQLGNRTREELRDEVFLKYSVTREEFRISHDYYQRDMQGQMRRVEVLSERLRAERDSIQEAERSFRLDRETLRVRDSLSQANDDSIRTAEPDSID
jgi:hypothetical protein